MNCASQFLIEHDLFGIPVAAFPIMRFPIMLSDKQLLQTRDFVEVKLGAALPGE